MWSLGFAIVQARSRKLLKRYAATPMRRSDYLLSFILSRLVFLLFETIAVIGFAWLAFGVEVRGSILSLTVVLIVGAGAFAGIGLLTAARPTTIEGASGLMNAVMMPMWLFSGTFFSAARFPEFIQPVIQVLPLTALNDALRAIMNDGATLASQWTELALLVAWGIVTYLLALRFFRWQ
jgi:ABC-type polysaccharide/polyol phosphate export permease